MKRLCVVFFLFLASCAHYQSNTPLGRLDPQHGYRFKNLPDDPAADETFIILTFSGGGTRAAALAYGTLAHLNATKISGGRTLLDEVDVISSISGGSFTGMAYALDRRFPMPDFERDFLYLDVQGDLVRAALNPLTWVKLLSPRYNRIDLATDYYDRHIFCRANVPRALLEGASPVPHRQRDRNGPRFAPDRAWLHLMDGGIADNIGLRGPLRSVLSTDPELSILRMIANERIKRLVFIVVKDRGQSHP